MNFLLLLLLLGADHNKYDISPTKHVREYAAFVSAFDDEGDNNGDGEGDRLGVPLWVAYQLDRIDGDLPSGGSRPRWAHDEELERLSLTPTDSSYMGSGYSRGHLCMRMHARRISREADHETHTLSNAVPQLQEGNAGAWLHLENQTAEWADEFEKVWIICGPVFLDAEYNWIGDGEGMPSYLV